MNHNELLGEAASKLNELIDVTTAILAANSKLPHTRAIIDSSMEQGTTREHTLTGGTLRAPGKPPFKYDKFGLIKLHQSVFEASQGTLYGIVMTCERASVESSWILAVKLVSRAEHAQVVAERQSVDAAVRTELAKLTTTQPDWERVSFGRDLPAKSPEVVVRGTSTGLQHSVPEARLLELLEHAESIYSRRGLELKIAWWTLGRQGLEFIEYYE